VTQTPVTFASPLQPASYSWEATDEEVAARYGIDVSKIVRFDLNTSPQPPDFLADLLAAGRFEATLSEYPPSDYRRLVEAASAAYGAGADEILVGAGADEILDLIGKAFISSGGTAVIPTPSYAMFRVVTEQRGARAVAVPRIADRAWAFDGDALREAASTADVVWLCSPNNPTALAEPSGAIETLLSGITADAQVDGSRPAVVVVDEAYAEFTGTSLLPLRARHPNLVLPSVTNFLLVRFGDPGRTSAAADALLRVGLVPRTFPDGHPLAAYLRLTVRSAAENDRLVAAAASLPA
jgi:histidinol-phosphate aminotransferase